MSKEKTPLDKLLAAGVAKITAKNILANATEAEIEALGQDVRQGLAAIRTRMDEEKKADLDTGDDDDAATA